MMPTLIIRKRKRRNSNISIKNNSLKTISRSKFFLRDFYPTSTFAAFAKAARKRQALAGVLCASSLYF